MQNKIAINFLSWIIFCGKEIAFMDNMQIRWITYWIAPYFIESMNGTDRKLKCSMYLTGVRAFAYPQSFTPLSLFLSLSVSLPPSLPPSLTLSPLANTSIFIYTFETTIGSCRCHRLDDTFVSVKRIYIFIFCHRLLANSPYFRLFLWYLVL